jgi:pilus assembly protein CpaE
MAGDDARREVVVIEGNQMAARQILSVLVGSPDYNTRMLAPDRALTAHPGWPGPDLLLVGLDSDPDQRLAYARQIQVAYPQAMILGYASAYSSDILAKATAGGARRVLRAPFDLPTLSQTIQEVRSEPVSTVVVPVIHPPSRSGLQALGVRAAPTEQPDHQVIALFSPKGGVGCSSLAVNLAVALQQMVGSTAVVDGNISFGSLEIFLELQPIHSILQLIGDVDQLTIDVILEMMVTHSTGLKVLLAPLRPEEGDGVRGEHLQRILGLMKKQFRFTLVDTWPSYDERVLAILEVADLILVPIGPDLPAMKNLNSFLRVARLLNYEMEKIVPVLMRANSVPPGHLKELEAFLKQPLRWRVVSDGKRATDAANSGTPFVLSAKDAPISQNVFDIAEYLIGLGGGSTTKETTKHSGGRFWRR